jgi:hypothetical protein
MVSDLITLVAQVLVILGIIGAVGGFSLFIVELFRDREHFFKHHPTKDCPTC